MSRILTNKDSNIGSPRSPTKSKSSSTSPIKNPSPSKKPRHCSPIRRHAKSSSTSGLNSASTSASTSPVKLGFRIFEDPISRDLYNLDVNDSANDSSNNDLEVNGQENIELQPKFTDFQQENILQPKLKVLKQKFRKPLGNLSINEFPGFVTNDGEKPIQLREPFVPNTYKNESNSIHKYFNNYPSYVSPMKSNHKFLFRSIESNEFNEDDALEHDLYKKSVLIKRKRSLSLGKNDLKLNLIKKNGFTILSN